MPATRTSCIRRNGTLGRAARKARAKVDSMPARQRPNSSAIFRVLSSDRALETVIVCRTSRQLTHTLASVILRLARPLAGPCSASWKMPRLGRAGESAPLSHAQTAWAGEAPRRIDRPCSKEGPCGGGLAARPLCAAGGFALWCSLADLRLRAAVFRLWQKPEKGGMFTEWGKWEAGE